MDPSLSLTQVWFERLLLAVGFGLLFLGAFRLNETMNEWVLYGQGIALLFVPAGVKNVAIMVGRAWGALGVSVALYWLTFDFWHNTSPMANLMYCVASVGSSFVGVELGLRWFQIDRGLCNLRFWHLPLLDLITTTVHGVTTNVYFIVSGMKDSDFVSNTLAMMVGDYLGNFLIMSALFVVLRVRRWLR